MDWQFTPYILILLAAAAITAGLTLLAWPRRYAPGARSFIALTLALTGWCLAYAVQLASAELDLKLFLSRLRFMGVVAVPTAWLVFALEYTGRARWLTRRNLVLLTMVPLATALLIWTNDLHHLFWIQVELQTVGSLQLWDSSDGIAFWVHATYSYVLMLAGTFLLLQAMVRSPRLYKGQAGVLVLSASLPLLGNMLTVFDLLSLPLDLTPFLFSIAGLGIGWALFRFRLLDLVPVARSAVVDGMGDGVMVLDAQNRIVDLNPAAQRIIDPLAGEAIGRPAGEVLASFTALVTQYRDVTQACDEITLGQGDQRRHYALQIAPLYDRRNQLTGRLVVLRDITAQKQTQEALEAQIQLFESLVKVARATSEHPTLKATLQNSLDVAAMLTGADLGSLFLLDAQGNVTDSILARGETGSLLQQQGLVDLVMNRGAAGWSVRQCRPALIDDVYVDERWFVLKDAPYAVRSALTVPILMRSDVLGVLTLTHPEPGHFDPQHVTLMQAAADQMALALRNAQMYEEQRRLAHRQTTLYQTLRTVGGQLEPETIAQTAVEAVARLAGWPAVAILLPDDGGNHLVVRAAAGVLAHARGWRLSVDSGVTGRAFRTGQTQHVPDVSTDPDYVSGHTTLCSELAVPLRRGARALGVLDLESDQLAAFDAEDVPLAESLADAIALALDNARLYAEVRHNAADLNSLYTVTRTVSRSLALEDVLSRALSAVLASLNFDIGLISLVEPSNKRLYLAVEKGLPKVMSERLRHDGLEGTLCAYVHEWRDSSTVSDFKLELPKDIGALAEDIVESELRAYVGIPLLHQEQSLGSLCLFSRQPRAFSAKEMALLNTMGQQIATAATNARLFQTIADERGRLQALIESSRDGIILVGMNLQVLLVNAQALHLLNLPGRPEDWIGRSLTEPLEALRRQSPAVVRATLAEMRRLRQRDQAPGEGEYEVSSRTIHWLNLPVMAGTTPLGRLLALRDVTKERLLDKMRDDLTRTMVHDLRNPLTAISVSLQLLDMTASADLPADQQQMLQSARSGAQRMLELVNNILDVSRLEGGRMRIVRVPVSLAELVAETLHTQSPLAAGKDLRLESQVPPSLPLALADASLMERVLQNLVDNAIKFTPDGGQVRIVVGQLDGERVERWRQRGVEPPCLFVSIADDGPGIPPEIKGQLFQKFATGPQEESGSGLGLAFCKLAVEAHQGRIWVESEPGRGTAFIFTLPIARETGHADVE